MANRPMPDAETIRNLLDCDPEIGLFTWKERGEAWWNAKFAGKQAGWRSSSGYICLTILAEKYLAHRVLWFLVHGTEPETLDHINGDPSDNRISNLRAVTFAENQRNTSRPSNNTSGVVGVGWNKRANRWCAHIKANGRHIYLGHFQNKEDAVAARKAAERQYGFHENHGREATKAA